MPRRTRPTLVVTALRHEGDQVPVVVGTFYNQAPADAEAARWNADPDWFANVVPLEQGPAARRERGVHAWTEGGS